MLVLAPSLASISLAVALTLLLVRVGRHIDQEGQATAQTFRAALFELTEAWLRIPRKPISQSGVFDHPRSEAAKRPTRELGSAPDGHLLSSVSG